MFDPETENRCKDCANTAKLAGLRAEGCVNQKTLGEVLEKLALEVQQLNDKAEGLNLLMSQVKGLLDRSKEELPKEEPIEKLNALHQLKIAGELYASKATKNSRWEPNGEPCVI